MYIAMEHDIILPESDVCVAWSADGRKVLAVRRTFQDLLQDAALCLQCFRHASGMDAILWVTTHDWKDEENRKTGLVTFFFTTEGRPTAEHLKAFGEPLERHGDTWSSEGVLIRPQEAFPSLMLRHGELHHLWAATDDKPVFLQLTSGGRKIREVSFDTASGRDFLPVAKHAVGIVPSRPSAAFRHKKQLRMAFAMRYVQRICEADGRLDRQETAFIKRSFPDEEVKDMWLDDPVLLERIGDEAEKELAEVLGHHEKVALLDLLYASCHSDGRLDVRELKVLKEATDALGLSRTLVMGYLQRSW